MKLTCSRCGRQAEKLSGIWFCRKCDEPIRERPQFSDNSVPLHGGGAWKQAVHTDG